MPTHGRIDLTLDAWLARADSIVAERWRHQVSAGTLVPLPSGIKDLNELGVGEGDSVGVQR
jgi:hypothetical protein